MPGGLSLHVVSVAKNDQLDNPVAMGCEVKGVYERVWQPSHIKFTTDICCNDKVSVVFDYGGHIHGQAFSDDVARRPLSNRRLTPVIAQLIVHQSVVDESSHQTLKIKTVGRLDVGYDRRRKYGPVFRRMEQRWHKNRLA